MLEEGNSGRSFYAATRKLASANPTLPWSVKDVFPGESCLGVGKEVLKHFGGIAATRGEPVPDIARTPGGLPFFSKARTEAILKKAEKADSMVEGDPLLNLVRCYPWAFPDPVSEIFNGVNNSGVWPETWKTEHLTIIPKTPNPSDLFEC